MSVTPTSTIKAQDHAIKSVTIFKSSTAEIVRNFTLNLKAGHNRVEIEGLPSTIDTQSVRVSGLGDARLSDVVCTVGANKEASYAHDSSSERIRLLEGQKQAVESEKRVRVDEAELLRNYAKTLSGEHVGHENMLIFLENFVALGCQNLKAVGELAEKIIKLDRQIERETDNFASKKGSNQGKVDVVLGTDEATSVDLKLTYIVRGVDWHPTYELHATTESGKPSPSVSLHYRARICQSTGEDWTNTKLTLSTVTSDFFARTIPQLYPVKFQARPRGSIHNNNAGGGFTFFGQPQNKFGPDGNGALFGQMTQQHQQPQPVASGFFGAAPTQQAPSGSIFGAMRQSTGPFGSSNSGPSAFGSNPLISGSSGFGSSGFGAPPPAVSTDAVTQPAVSGSSSGGANSALVQGTGIFGSSASPSDFIPPTLDSGSSGFGAFGSRASAPTVSTDAVPVKPSEEEQFEDVSLPATITEPTTFVTETPVAISYSITGESTIPSDGIEHQVSVATLPFEADISYVAIPRIEPRVYLQCQVKNTSEYKLLAGPVTVILDESYVSKTFIPNVNMGDNFDCTLGHDPATKVTYSRTSRLLKAEGGSFTESMNTIAFTTKITINNRHPFVLPDLVVRDIVPTCDDKRAKVILRKPEGLAEAKDGKVVVLDRESGLKVMWQKLVDGKGGEKEGRFEWKGTVKAKDKLVLEAQWELKAPADSWWTETYPSTPFRPPGGH